ncbi:MAG: hydroxymethylbilane synthase [Hyphomicrobiales bacterium]|nr:hydroxymethylbilane synthase [Hyphomicrobiales bacterium]
MTRRDSTTTIRIGTRSSPLALAQANEVKQHLIAAHGGNNIEVEIIEISTKGDRILDRALSEIGGKGLFTEEIEKQLLENDIDIAVHSTKDMPTELPQGLELSCFLPREAPADAFISGKASTIEELPQGAVIGSASLRRQALIRRMRPDIEVITFRGNVQSRLRKLKEGVVDATLLAEAGLNRLGMQHIITSILPLDRFPPAPGQGVICIESRINDDTTGAILAPLNDADTHTALRAERSFLAALDGSCRTPLAGYAFLQENQLHFHGMILSPDGKNMYETTRTGNPDDGAALGADAARQLRHQAGDGFFADWS